jgi:DNA topoisomerase-1
MRWTIYTPWGYVNRARRACPGGGTGGRSRARAAGGTPTCGRRPAPAPGVGGGGPTLAGHRASMDVQDHTWWRRVPDEEEGFRYLKVDGGELRSVGGLARIADMAIPPGWRDVHVAPDAARPIQAWGTDDAGRRQYIYSDDHVGERERRKWARTVRLLRSLPTMRARTNAHLAKRGAGRERVMATVVRLMSRGFFRVGGERYAERNGTFGIATLRKKHLTVRGNDLVFSYIGKGSKRQFRIVADTPLVEIIRSIRRLPGDRLFQYRASDRSVQRVTAAGVNRYLREILGEGFSAKDFRTLGATARAATILADLGPAASAKEATSNVVLCCRLVASELGNTPAVTRSSYIHPAVLEQYEEHGRTMEKLMRSEPREIPAEEPVTYYPEEGALLRFLERHG